jgi:membrane protein DedA with SNARE-associated domain
MSEKIIALLVQFVTHVIDSGGYTGIVALLAMNSACIPLPSEIVMPFAGYLVYLGRFGGGNTWMGLPVGLLWVATAGCLGCNLGSAFAYWIGASGGRPLVERYGKWVLMNRRDLDLMTAFFNKYGSITVLLARLLPIVQTFIAFPAGIARMPRLRFHIYTSLGSWSWYLCLAYVGMKLGERWHTDPRLYQIFHHFHLVVEIALVLGVLCFLWLHLKHGRPANEA